MTIPPKPNDTREQDELRETVMQDKPGGKPADESGEKPSDRTVGPEEAEPRKGPNRRGLKPGEETS
jgi:hypothetical protein